MSPWHDISHVTLESATTRASVPKQGMHKPHVARFINMDTAMSLHYLYQGRFT